MKQGPDGSYRITDGNVEMRFVPPAEFEAHARSLKGATIQRGEYFNFAATDEIDKLIFLFANLVPLQKEGINQDTAFHRRQELARFLDPPLSQIRDISRQMRRVKFPSLIFILSCLEAMEEKSTAEVMRVCTRNTQHLLDEKIEALLDRPQQDDLWLNIISNTRDKNFTHTDLFARIYAEQIRILKDAIQRDSNRQQVVVLGCGRGHDLLSLSHYAAKHGFIDRICFVGVDQSESDLEICREMLTGVPKIHVRLRKDDISSKGFTDRLRRYSPDFVIANHVLEHLWAEDLESDLPTRPRLEILMNRYLHPWLFAARKGLLISIPLDDELETSISDHMRVFSEADLEEIGRSMPQRCALATETLRLGQTKKGGLCTWIRAVEHEAFNGPYLQIAPRSEPVTGCDATFLEDFSQPFNPSKFGQIRKAPKVAEIEDKATFAIKGASPHQVRQLLIKIPHSDIHLPNEFAQCAEAVQLIVDHNKAVNPLYEISHAFFNIFRGTTSFSEYRGLSLNPHGDQLQTLLTGYAYPPDFSYIVSTCIPTVMFEQPFDVSNAVKRARAGKPGVNLYDEFTRQLQFDRKYYTQNFSIYLLSPYVVHSASEAKDPVFRVFMKVAFSTKRYFDNREFRRNMAFDYADWFEKDTLTYGDGFFQHMHWNECYLAEDVVPNDSVAGTRAGRL